MVIFAVVGFLSVFTVFCGGFLCFIIQPAAVKLLLPELGGGSWAWALGNIAFQAGLLLGYLYALILSRLGRGTQLCLHFAVTLGCFSFLFVSGTLGGEAWGAFWTLAGVLLAYITLSSTSPLVQFWLGTHSSDGGLGSIYRLFSYSNIAALAGLFSYPFLIEAHIGLAVQIKIWVFMFAIHSLSMILLGCRICREPRAYGVSAGFCSETRIVWAVIPAITTAYLVSLVSAFSQSIPPSPFVWTVPLALYLLSYALAFGGIVNRFVETASMIIFLAGILSLGFSHAGVESFGLSGFHKQCFIMFFACLALHGRLFLSRPSETGITVFYALVGAGGLFGGICSAGAFPYMFHDYMEIWVLLAGIAAALMAGSPLLSRLGSGMVRRVVVWAGLFAAMMFFLFPRNDGGGIEVLRLRNYLGSCTVYDYFDPEPFRMLRHGGTLHGIQYTGVGRGGAPSTYYAGGGGLGSIFETLSTRGGSLNIVCVGVGVGTVAAWTGAGDRLEFIDIDPNIVRIAEECFSFSRDARTRGCSVSFSVGDGRKIMESLEEGKADLVIVDAFSGDSVPLHLMTKEAMETYARRLKPDGFLAIHISSRTLDLGGVARGTLAAAGLPSIILSDGGGERSSASVWVVAARSVRLLDEVSKFHGSIEDDAKPDRVWTDDFSCIHTALK